MSNATILQNHNTIINDNNLSIDELIESINNLPEAGSGEVEITLQEKTITPTTTQQEVIPDSDYNGLGKVIVNAVDSSIDENIKSSNIKKDITILGVEGTLEEGITPSGELSITQNGTYDVTEYATVNVASEDPLKKARSIIDKTITSYSDDELTEIGIYMFYNCSKMAELNTPNVTIVGEYAFQGSKIPTIYFPKLTEAVQNTFRNAKSIKSLDLPNCIKLGNASVYSCTALTSINIPKVEELVRACMTSCTSLEHIDLPVCTTIGTQVFNKCTALKTVILRSETICTLAGTDAFGSCSALESIYVPDELVDEYKAATNWSSFASQIKPLGELIE